MPALISGLVAEKWLLNLEIEKFRKNGHVLRLAPLSIEYYFVGKAHFCAIAANTETSIKHVYLYVTMK